MYVLPRRGQAARVSNRSQQAILEFNKRQKITYSAVKREIFLTQLLGEGSEYDSSYTMLWPGQDGDEPETWSGFQHLIPAPVKDDFFLQFVWRIPGMVYCFNPESALASGTNILLRDILGSEDPKIWHDFTDKYLGFIRGFQSRWFPYLLLASGTGVSHPVLPMEIKVGAYLSLICCHLETMVALNIEEPSSFPMISSHMVHTLCLPLTSEGANYIPPSDKTRQLVERQERRSNVPGFWTDLLCHFRCIICSQFLESGTEAKKGVCPNQCLQENTTVKCSLCNTVMVGEKQMILPCAREEWRRCVQFVLAGLCREAADASLPCPPSMASSELYLKQEKWAF